MRIDKYLLSCLAVGISLLVLNSPAKGDQYRSKTNGYYHTASTWQASTDGGQTWHDAESAPGSDDDVEIIGNHTVEVAVTGVVQAHDLTVENGTLTGDGAGTNVFIVVKGEFEQKQEGKVTSQPSTDKPPGYVWIKAEGDIVLAGSTYTGDASGHDQKGNGINSAFVVMHSISGTVYKKGGCLIGTGSGGQGVPAVENPPRKAGNGGNSGDIHIQGSKEKDNGVKNGPKSNKIKIGQPGEPGGNNTGNPELDGSPGKKGKPYESGRIIISSAEPGGPGYSSVEGGIVDFVAIDSIILTYLPTGAITADSTMHIYVDGLLDLRGCTSNTFVSGNKIYVDAADILTDPGVSIEDLMDPDPVFGRERIPTLTQWGLIVFAGLFILSLIFMLTRKTARLASRA